MTGVRVVQLVCKRVRMMRWTVGSYRGIKLLEHAMKVFERVIETRIRKAVKIDDMQFGFQSGKGTTDATFIVRQLQEKYMAAKRTCGWRLWTLKRPLTECQ